MVYNEIFKIIKELQEAKGNLAKQAILQREVDNLELQTYLKAVYDPAINYYQKKIKVGKSFAPGMAWIDGNTVNEIVDTLSNRKLTGNEAKNWLGMKYDYMYPDSQELLTYMINRSIGSDIGDTMILNVWPKLYFRPPYMRCSLMTPKIRKHFEGLKRIIVQKKADGSFAYVQTASNGDSRVFTRAGTAYPQWFAERISKGLEKFDRVYVGEFVIYKNGKLLDRKTGNGIYNSILKNGDEEEFKDCDFVMQAWDFLPTKDFEAGYCPTRYEDRYYKLAVFLHSAVNITLIDTDFVDDLAAAYKIYSKYTKDGFEGAVVKDPDAPWKDHTSPFNVKLKIEFEADYEITHVAEGTGKASGMMGAVGIKSKEGKIVSDVGTGWTDDERKAVWEDRENMPGRILTVKANDIISNRGSETLSLFLPVAIEIRSDKIVADTYEQCTAQLEAAKGN